MSAVPQERVDTLESIATAWLTDFAAAVGDNDAAVAAELFASDSHWRDILTFTWDMRTFSGTDRIAAALRDTITDATVANVRLSQTTPPRHVTRAGVDTIEVIFEFDAAAGRSSGVVRLVPSGQSTGQWRAWMLLTALQEMAGLAEPLGANRPKGESYSRNFGGPNWLDQRNEAREYRTRDPEVLIVGGGQAGLGLAARLGQLGVDALIVDRMARVGDNWRNRYHSLTLHNEVWVNHLPYLPFPPNWPTYIPKDKLANWFESYVDIMEINFWTGTEFVDGQYDAGEGRWNVVLERDGTRRNMRPMHVVMATGVSGIPSIPDLPGLDDFAGTLMHSSSYTDGTEFAGQRVIVVGTGNSGHDVAQDLHSCGAEITLVQRSPTTVVSIEPSAQQVYAT